MKRKIIASLLALSMVAVMFVGCGSSDDSTDGSVAEDTTEDGGDALANNRTADDEYQAYWDVEEELGDLPAEVTDLSVKIGFCGKAFENEFWRMEKEGTEEAQAAFQELGIDVTIEAQSAAGESDEQGQETVLKAMINGDYDALIIAPISDSNLTSALEEAVEAGIPMTYNNDMDANVTSIPAVAADHKDTAEKCCQWIAEQIGEEGQVAVVQGLPTAEAARLRTDCFVEYAEANYPNIEVVAQQNADWDRTKAKDVAATIIKQYPDLKAIYANNDTMAMGVLEAVKEANKLGEILVVGTDGTSEALESIKAGELSATMNDFPYYQSQVSCEMLLRRLAGQEVPTAIYSPHAIVDSSNCNEENADILGWTGWAVAE